MSKSLRSFAGHHLGGTLRTVDPSGNLVDDIRYNAFGSTRSGGTATPTDKRFTGQMPDASTGLYDYGARLYDPALCRFVSPDPVVPNPKNPQSLNRYSYALNNPLRYIDPTGYDEDPPEGEPPQETEAPQGDPNGYDLGAFGGGPDPSGIAPDEGVPSPKVVPDPAPEPEPPQPMLWVPYTESPEPSGQEVEPPVVPAVIVATGVIGGQTVTSPFVAGGDGSASGTWGVGLGGTAGLGGGVSGSVMLVGDFGGNLALAISAEGGGYAGIGASGALIFQGTNAPTVQSLAGPVTQTGGSITVLPVAPLNLGTEAVVQQGVMGANVSVGAGFGIPVETHGLGGYTWLIRLR